MTILRGALPSDHFTIISNAWLRDPALSWKAKGLLAYVASHAPGHTLTLAQMVAEGRDKLDAVRAALTELDDAGYLRRIDVRNEKGHRTGTDYELCDPQAGKAQMGKSHVGADQPKDDVSAGQAQMGKSQVGKSDPKKTTPKEEKTKENTSSFDAEASPTTQTIIAGLIDWLALPEQGGVQLTKRVIGIYAKGIKEMLAEDIPDLLIKRALVEMHHRGMIGRPSLLPSFVVQVQGRPASAPPAGPKLFEELREERAAQRKTRSQAIDAVMERLKVEHPGMSISEMVRKAAELVDTHIKDHPQRLNSSSATGYIDVDVIETSAPKEVTGHAA